MKYSITASLLFAATVLSSPVPTPTSNLHQNLARQEPTTTATPTCPYSVTVTATRSCTAPACEDPLFCAAMVNLQSFGCDCLTKPPSTTTVTKRCDSDCDCAIPTSWVVPKGCDVEAVLKGEKGPVKVNPNKEEENVEGASAEEGQGKDGITEDGQVFGKGPIKVNPNKDIDNLL
ncbi:hypothetical protein TWF569_008981 [Orbilia oligospora]|uniref:Extracellular membrane protein CFEM domain-containing protein n=1 Tax=Orbilia oligospora TaxID=2813651 RepID=A0A7C8NP64_ORBOL|nr:hypothetical protein TWF102_008368 [Orbilia oligospora]KAF3096279.1 hypothetical protein TWF103_009852 [Orbilia oligospora]KAF3097960.1 hypothetical protein TWF706_006902 [Orbilia oligospora]KAF3123519.1 hypothetical protein TWF703_000731 [Orbilia oligospora]KAF3145419.1 hypothetical protein TWF594_004356 [Orbilia oligospora]